MMFDLRLAEARLRATVAQHRAEHTARRQLAAELATYKTPADLADLHAMIARNRDEDTVEIREILARQRAA